MAGRFDITNVIAWSPLRVLAAAGRDYDVVSIFEFGLAIRHEYSRPGPPPNYICCNTTYQETTDFHKAHLSFTAARYELCPHCHLKARLS